MLKTPKYKKPQESYVETNHLVLPSHANALGTIFGGVVMSWIDIAAAISAQRYSKRVSVTASVDALHFIAPMLVGDSVNIKAKVVFTGRTSMIVFVEVTSEKILTGEKKQCVTAHLSMVALDLKKEPAPVPKLLLTTKAEKEAFSRAAERRAFLLSQLKNP
ncbi:MAG: Acyl-CoA hydrolase [Bacteriovoracaceae bacterium]|nr:Acyl-CoA hydrolase [Bacteriovoracaceae bacterium]